MNMAPLTSASYWIDVGERTIRTFAGATLSALGLGALSSPSDFIVNMPWALSLLFGASSAAITLLMALASIGVPGSDPLTGSALPPPAQTPAAFKAFFGRHKGSNESPPHTD
jgi:hypothetical protein